MKVIRGLLLHDEVRLENLERLLIRNCATFEQHQCALSKLFNTTITISCSIFVQVVDVLFKLIRHLFIVNLVVLLDLVSCQKLVICSVFYSTGVIHI